MAVAPEMEWEQDRLLALDRDMERLDTEKAEEVLRSIVGRYESDKLAFQYEIPLWRWPLWQLVQDIRRQAAVHANIIEQLKSGEDVRDVRRRFHDDLGLVSSDAIPTSRGEGAIRKAFNKVSHYGTTLVILVRDYGQRLLGEVELDVGAQFTTALEVQLGLTGPSLTLGTSFTGNGSSPR